MTKMNKKVMIEGEKVHRVGYRPFLMAKARRLGIPNYESDNVEEAGKQRVIVSVGGDGKQVQDFVEFVKDIENRPPKAKVSRTWEAEPPEYVMPIGEYDKVLAADQRNTIVQAGLGMIEIQQTTVGNQEKMLDKHDQMLDKHDQMLDKQDQMLGMQKQTIEEIKTVGVKVDNVATKVDNVADKIDSGFEKTDQGFATLGDKIDSGFEKTDQDFQIMRSDYGKISVTMEKINDNLEKLVKTIIALVEKKS